MTTWNGYGPWGSLADFAEMYGATESQGKRGLNYVFPECPNCGWKKTLYLLVESDDPESYPAGSWVCYKCQKEEDGGAGKGRDGFLRLYALLEGVDYRDTASDYFKWLQKSHPVTVDVSALRIKPERSIKPVAPDEVEGWEPCWNPETKKYRMPRYLIKRGVTKEQARRFGIGYCLKGPLKNRIVFPIHHPIDEELVGYCARAILPKMEPRYRNSENANGMVFGWPQSKGAHTVIIVEGAFDALAVDRAGYTAIGILGSSLHSVTDIEVETIESYVVAASETKVRRIILMLDPTAIGKALTQVSTERKFSWEVAELKPIGRTPKEKLDPGSATVEEIREAIKNAKPAFDAWEKYLADELDNLLKEV